MSKLEGQLHSSSVSSLSFKPKTHFPKKSISIRKPPKPKTAKQRVKAGLRKLQGKVELINQLSTELETAICELKAIATQVNKDSHYLNRRRINVCEYRSVKLPAINQEPSGRLIVSSRPVNFLSLKRKT